MVTMFIKLNNITRMQQYGSKYFARRAPTTQPLPALRVGSIGQNSTFTKDGHVVYRPLAGYGLPPPRGNFVNHIILKAQCLASILQHVSPPTMAALSCNSLLHTLPYKIFVN